MNYFSSRVTNKLRKELKILIAKGKTKKVIQNLLDLVKTFEDRDIEEEVILQSARFEQNDKNYRIGKISSSENEISIAKTNQALLHLVEKLPIDSFPNKIKLSSNKKNKIRRRVFFVMFFLSTFVLILLFSVSYSTPKEKLEIKLNNLRDTSINFEKKEEIISGIITESNVKTVVYIKGKEGNIINEIQLETYLKELCFGLYENTYIESYQNNNIVIRHR